MKKHTLIPALLAVLLSLGAATMIACTETPGEPAESVTETAPDTADTADTGAQDTETEVTPAESETETEAAPESETTPDTGSSETETRAPETDPPETEAVTAPPRYDYMEAEVLPDVTIDEDAYTDMTLNLPADLQVTDAQVKEYIEFIRFDYRTAVNGDTQVTDQPMKLGDDAFIFYKGVLDGEEFEGGSNWDDKTPYQLGLGSGAFIPGFEAGLVGVIPANATKENPAEVHLTFPENYDPALAGKDVIFYVAVEYAVQYTLPVYDRDFVENTLKYEGEKDFYTDAGLLAEFEQYIRSYLEEELAADVENAKINALWEHLVTSATYQNLPQLELDFYYSNYLSEIEYYYEYYKSYGGEEFLKEYPTLDDFAKAFVGVEEGKDWKDELTAMAERMVKKDMVTHAIAEAEGIESVTDEEYKAEVAYWVSQYQGYMTEEEIIQSMGEIYLRESAFAAKMQTWLLERVTFTFESAAE